MTRDEILSGFDNLSVSEHDFLVDIADHFESKFSEISDLLDVKCVEDLSRIKEAKDLVDIAKSDLY